MVGMGKAAESVMAARGIPILDAATVVTGWANATPDGWHYDGGGPFRAAHKDKPSVRYQVVSINLLNLMLNAVSRVRSCGTASRDDELCGNGPRRNRSAVSGAAYARGARRHTREETL